MSRGTGWPRRAGIRGCMVMDLWKITLGGLGRIARSREDQDPPLRLRRVSPSSAEEVRQKVFCRGVACCSRNDGLLRYVLLKSHVRGRIKILPYGFWGSWFYRTNIRSAPEDSCIKHYRNRRWAEKFIEVAKQLRNFRLHPSPMKSNLTDALICTPR